MELILDKNECHSKGIVEQTSFRVASNAKIMSMLSDQLYSDKVLAVIRELSCNAFDSHLMVGRQTKPFAVHLPCSLNPIFSIRDYGKGMTEAEITELYTVYGFSDKSDSNSFIGAFGIGSKSPFAYCNSFSVTSFKDGKRYVYIASKNNVGIPTLNKMLEEPTNEENGVEISFTVKQQNFSEFTEKAKLIYRHFPVMPIFTGNITSYVSSKRNVLLEGTGWKLYEGSTDSSVALMGYVEYKIDAKHFSKFYDSNQTNRWYHKSYEKDSTEAELLQLGLELHFAIGDLGTNISREALEYTDHTINGIKEHLKVVAKELEEKIVANFKNCKTLWEARCLYNELFVRGSMNNLRKIASVVSTNWNGSRLDQHGQLTTSETLDIVNVSHGKSYIRRRHSHTINSDRETKFYVNDIKKGVYGMAERDSRAMNSNIWILTFKGTDAEQAAAKQYVFNELGIVEEQLIYASTLTPVKTPSTGPRKTKMFEFQNQGNNFYSYGRHAQANWWEQKTVDLNNGGVYIQLSGYVIASNADGTGGMDGKELYNILEHATALKIKIPTVYGLRPSHVKVVKNESNWTNLYTYLKDELQKILTKNNYVDMVEEIKQFNDIKNDIYEDLIKGLNKFSKKLPATSMMANFLTNFDRIAKLQKTLGNIANDLTSLASMVQCNLVKGTVFDSAAEEKKVMATYPLLQFIRSYQIEQKTDINALLNYVYMTDSQ